MKKLFSLPVLALAALVFASCSNKDDFESSGAEITDPTSRVAISLNASTATSRNIINSDENGNFEADSIGVFMLAKAKASINTREWDITWNNTDSLSPGYFAAWWDNISGKAIKEYNADGTVASTRLRTEYTDNHEDYHAFYPSGDWYLYNFYAYAPRIVDSLVVKTDTSRVVNIPIDGQTDVIWGKATSDDYLAYSAKYFRQTSTNGIVPCINMKHTMMRLQFYVKAGTDTIGGKTYDGALKMGVYSIKVLDLPTSGTLNIAEQSGLNEGEITYDWYNNLQNIDIPDSIASFYSKSNHLVIPDPTKTESYGEEIVLGQSVVVPVPINGIHKIAVTLYDKNTGELFPCERPMEVHLGAFQPYQTGYIYKVVMTVHGPKLIDNLKATLVPWKTSDDKVTLEFN